jgi:phosphoglycolate phosphatase-like HAD superfamily hydrolase
MDLELYLKQHPKRCIIFDFDGTLFQLDYPWKLFRAELDKKFATIDATLVEDSREVRTILYINEAVKKYGERASTMALDWSEEFERTQLKGVREHGELTSFIRTYYQRYEFFIWSSNMRHTIESLLLENGLEECFKKIITLEDVRLRKPEIEGFGLMFDPTCHQLSDFVMVGDSAYDEEASRRVGIDFVKVEISEKC